MADGPNYEEVFRKMQCLRGDNPEGLKTIVRYLRFFKGTDEYELYIGHYLPMLPPDVAVEFKPKAEVKEVVVETVIVHEPSVPVTETVTKTIPKKRGRKPKISA